VDFAYSRSYRWQTCLKVVWLDSSTCFKHNDKKTACKNSEKYKSYDNFKMVYNHDAEHDVAKHIAMVR